MLDLGDNWDGEGSLGYDESTWRRAIELAIEIAHRFWRNRWDRPLTPMIMKGPEGSIDLLWQTPRRELLLNVSTDVEEPATFYGHDRAVQRRTVEGKLDPAERNEWLLVWLTE